MNSSKLSIALGCDEAAYTLKENIRAYLEKQGHTVKDYGVYNTEPSLYPNIALEVSSAVADGSTSAGFSCVGLASAWPLRPTKCLGSARRYATMCIRLNALGRATIAR